MSGPVLATHDVYKTYLVDPPVEALKGVEFSVNAGERVAVIGHSGSGKSTFLNIIGLLDRPTQGRVEILGHDVTNAKPRELDRLRSEVVGFVFQEHHVLGARTVQENLRLRLAVSSIPEQSWAHAIDSVLTSVHLQHRTTSLGRLLSGGEKQRLAVARALISNPKILLADEPTGNLDTRNAHSVMELFDAQAAQGVAVIVITHDDRVAEWADRTLVLEKGVLRGA